MNTRKTGSNTKEKPSCKRGDALVDLLDATDSSEKRKVSQSGGIVAPFLTKTYEMVNDKVSNHMVRWGKEGRTFMVLKPEQFAKELLPCYFKHNNFASFVRQLNTYGFKKGDPEKWEFSNDNFVKGKPHLLANIERRRPPQQQLQSTCAFSEDNNPGELVRTIEELKRDNQVLMLELIRLLKNQHIMSEQLKTCIQFCKGNTGGNEYLVQETKQSNQLQDAKKIAEDGHADPVPSRSVHSATVKRKRGLNFDHSDSEASCASLDGYFHTDVTHQLTQSTQVGIGESSGPASVRLSKELFEMLQCSRQGSLHMFDIGLDKIEKLEYQALSSDVVIPEIVKSTEKILDITSPLPILSHNKLQHVSSDMGISSKMEATVGESDFKFPDGPSNQLEGDAFELPLPFVGDAELFWDQTFHRMYTKIEPSIKIEALDVGFLGDRLNTAQ